MAKPFNNIDAKRIISEHKNTLEKLKEIQNSITQSEQSIKKASDEMVSREVLNILREIPIEELSREKQGIRVKSLRDHGYNTIADIATQSIYSIASVKRISQDMAITIKRIADNIVDTARKGIKIKLSADNKNKDSSKLVFEIAKYQMIKPLAVESKQLFNKNDRLIRYAIIDLTEADNGLKWIFASKQKKQKATDAYNLLANLLENEYKQQTQDIFSKFDESEKLDYATSWNEFSKNPVIFFNILEDINPDILGNDDTMYGLPEDLAREIQDECFFPDGLLCELRRYQEWGVKYALHQERVLLGDEMGLGKTVQAIATMVSLKNTGATHFVVVCPASVLTNWCREITKMSRLSVTKVHGAGRSVALKSWLKTGGVAVTTYETTSYFKLEDNFKFSLLVVDEAHYIKNPDANRTQNVYKLGEHSERMLFMTGTALENKVDEMISLIKVLQPNVAKNVRGMEALSTAPRFRNEVAPVYYRRKREDVLTELPELIESKEWCSLNKTEEAAYEQAIMSKNYMQSRRVSWNIDNMNESSKATRLLELVQEAESDGRKIIVFSFFLDTISKVLEILGKRCMNPINGSITPQRRQEIIDEFDKAPAGTVLAAQIQSGGTGLNIQSASVVIICEPQLKPSIENQAISRAYRMGQSRNVLVYRLLCENTIDEKITETLENKQAIFDAFADKSDAAKESLELDNKTLGNIIEEEIARINAKNQNQENDKQ